MYTLTASRHHIGYSQRPSLSSWDDHFSIQPILRASSTHFQKDFQHQLVMHLLSPTLMLHGTADTAVPVLSSRRMKLLLTNAGATAELIELEGKEHLFDTEPNNNVEYAGVYDKVEEFLKKCMQK
jgi:dipeptidyl aminopeptidase/acylaminoacyl peptidase